MLRKILKIIVLTIILVQTTFAQKVVAILEIVPTGELDLTISEYRHLTDELRTRAREALPRNNYTVLTRDNIFQLLPPESEQTECLDEACAVEIGRAIGAEYVTQGFVGKFGGMLTLTVEFYESMSGNLLGSFVTESKDVMGLLATIRERAPNLFAQLSEPFPSVREVPESQPTPHSPLATPKKSNSPLIIALSLDALGAIALGFGIYQHINANKQYEDYKKMHKGEDYEKALQKANDTQQMRNIWLSIGGGLLATGIAVHIWF